MKSLTRLVFCLGLAVGAAACSDSDSPNGSTAAVDAGFLPDAKGPDVANADTATTGSDVAAVTDAGSGGSDALSDATTGQDLSPGSDVPEGPDIDYDLLDPEEDTVDGGPVVPVNPDLTTIYAHTSSELYKLDNNTFTKIGTFGFNKYPGSVTDIALDDKGKLFAVTFDELFQCETKTAKCTWLATLPQSFNGLTFVPPDTAVPGKSALIGIANSGDWNLITVGGGFATIKKLGSYGNLSSSGDAFSLEGSGTYATVKSFGGSSDILVEVDPATGSVQKQIGPTGVDDLWGVAWSKGVMYGFSSGGAVYSIDLQTGKASTIPGLKVPSGVSWWGAGVSTRAALSN